MAPTASPCRSRYAPNLYRWLVGLEPVGLAAALLPNQQACAALLVGIGHLTHSPPREAPCYTDAGAQGAGSSNLAMGAGPWDSVDLYVGDRGVPSLGHRRWIFNPGMGETAFGAKQRFSCMYSFSMSGRGPAPDMVAWPPPGPVPADAAAGEWSITLHRVSAGPEFQVRVGMQGAEPTPVEARALGGNYGGGSTWSFPAVAGGFRAGAEARVEVTGLRDGSVRAWTTRFVACR